MNVNKFFGVVALGLCGIFAASSASAAPINCTDQEDGQPFAPGAIANELDPTLCAAGNYSGNPGQQAGFMDSEFPGTFTFAGKTGDENVQVGDFDLILGDGSDGWDFSFTFSSESLLGQTIAFVLLVKVGNNDHAYYWESLVLDIDGFFNSFNVNPNDPDFSHVSAFYRLVDAPEPGTLALLALGLLGIGFARRRATSR